MLCKPIFWQRPRITKPLNQIYNVAVDRRTNLLELLDFIKTALTNMGVNYSTEPTYQDDRADDARQSQCVINNTRALLGNYEELEIKDSLTVLVKFYLDHK